MEINIDNLKKERDALRKKTDSLQSRIDAATRQEMLPDLKKNFIGKYFKTRNRFGGNSKGWWLYQHVIDFSEKDFNIPNPDFKIFLFEVMENGSVRIEIDKYTYQNCLGQEITRKEFMAAYEKMIQKISRWALSGG